MLTVINDENKHISLHRQGEPGSRGFPGPVGKPGPPVSQCNLSQLHCLMLCGSVLESYTSSSTKKDCVSANRGNGLALIDFVGVDFSRHIASS